MAQVVVAIYAVADEPDGDRSPVSEKSSPPSAGRHGDHSSRLVVRSRTPVCCLRYKLRVPPVGQSNRGKPAGSRGSALHGRWEVQMKAITALGGHRRTGKTALAGLIILLAIGATLLAAHPAGADSGGKFCPPTGDSMSMAPGNDGMCIHGRKHNITYVSGYRYNNQNAVHCVGANQYRSPTSSHVISYSCGIGSSPNGWRHTDYIANGRYGYPIHKNDASITLSGFWGRFSFVTGTIAADSDASSPFRVQRAQAPVVQSLRGRFGVLRRARTPGDHLGSAAQGPALSEIYVDQTRSVPLGAAGRAVGTPADTSKVWVTAGPHDQICLLTMAPDSDGPASQCLSAAKTEAGMQLMTRETASNDVDLAGVVPDGVSTVHVVLGDGRIVGLPVNENVYRAHLDAQVRSVTFDGPDGPVTFVAEAEPVA